MRIFTTNVVCHNDAEITRLQRAADDLIKMNIPVRFYDRGFVAAVSTQDQFDRLIIILISHGFSYQETKREMK